MSDKGNRITHKSTRKCQVFISYLCQDCFFGSLSTFQPCIPYRLYSKKSTLWPGKSYKIFCQMDSRLQPDGSYKFMLVRLCVCPSETSVTWNLVISFLKKIGTMYMAQWYIVRIKKNMISEFRGNLCFAQK